MVVGGACAGIEVLAGGVADGGTLLRATTGEAGITGGIGGGGGSGRIRINTSSGAANLGGTVSPASSTPCFTQGPLLP